MKRIKVLCVLGTRPEVIKMAPVVHELRSQDQRFESVVVSTSQHREMLEQVLAVFSIEPDIDLNVMRPRQSLSHITVAALQGVESVLRDVQPDVILVQGDTTTVFAASLAAFYCRVPVGHIEAGLRSFDRFNPYPEEVNRCLTDVITDFYFAPTERARSNLIREGVTEDAIFVTGNTVVDALQFAEKLPFSFDRPEFEGVQLDEGRTLLVTAHRRENHDGPFKSVCLALVELVGRFEDLQLVYPVHLNPAVREPAHELLGGTDRIHLIPPLDYLSFVNMMKKSHLILTDSGGVQEEAPSFGKPVLVLRKVTERPEAYEEGVARVIGTDQASIVGEVSRLLEDPEAYRDMARVASPYGDGNASVRIVQALSDRLS